VHGEHVDRVGARRRRRRRGITLAGECIEGIAREAFRMRLCRQCLNELLRIQQITVLFASGRPAQAQPGAREALPERQCALRTE